MKNPGDEGTQEGTQRDGLSTPTFPGSLSKTQMEKTLGAETDHQERAESLQCPILGVYLTGLRTREGPASFLGVALS